MKNFDKHIQELLETHPEAALEHAKVFAELPIATQLSVMRRRRNLSQRQLAKKLKEMRKKHDLTQEEMSEKLQMDLRYYQRLESAKPNAVKIDTIDKISKVLKISASKLLDFE